MCLTPINTPTARGPISSTGRCEIEERHTILGQPGKARVTGYVNRGEMGQLKDAVNLA